MENDKITDALLEYAPAYTEKNFENIKTLAFKKIKPRNSIKKYFFAASAAAVLMMSAALTVAAAMGVELGGLLNSFFNNPAVTEKININKTVKQNGIEIKLISAYSDGDIAYALLELSDTEQSRLSDIKFIFSQINSNAYICNPVIYDATGKKATLAVKIIYHKPIELGDDISLIIDTLVPRVEYINEQPIDLSVYPLAFENKMISFDEWNETAADGNKKAPGVSASSEGANTNDFLYLEIGSLDYEIPGINYAVISNAGFYDGMFHLQLKKTEMFNNYYNNSNLFILDKDGNNIYPLCDVSIGAYQEYIFNIGDVNKLKDMSLAHSGIKAKEFINGPWNINFTIEALGDKKTLNVEPQTSPYFNRIEIECSPMKIAVIVNASVFHDNLESVKEMSGFFCGFGNPFLTLTDGSTITSEVDAIMFDNMGGTADYNVQYFDISQLKSITICGEEYFF